MGTPEWLLGPDGLGRIPSFSQETLRAAAEK